MVLSCLPIGPPGGAVDSNRSASTIRANAEVARLREITRLVAVEPDFSDLEAPLKMLDPQIAVRALDIGKRQAEREAATIRAAWDALG